MKKGTFITAMLFLVLFLPGQEIQEEAIAINIEVPVRVYKGDTFVEDLTIDDFEVYENGKLQKIEAVYLIKKAEIEKEELEKAQKKTGKEFKPETSRYFVFIFSLYEYLPKINELMDYFFQEIFLPGDTLNVATPLKTYNLNPSAIAEKISNEEIKKKLILILRRDIQIGSGTYRALMREVEEYALDLDAENYVRTMQELQQFRYVDLEKMEEFSNYLKAQKGQKHVFLFHQQESIPLFGEFQRSTAPMVEIYDPSRPGGMTIATQNYLPELLQMINFNTETIKHLFADSSISAHFLYVTKPLWGSTDITRMGSLKGLRHKEITEDIFNAFRRIAEDTGGVVDSSANISAAFKKAAYASENYYLLYYSPVNYKADGKFKHIEVKVKGRNYRVTHRAGYIAD